MQDGTLGDIFTTHDEGMYLTKRGYKKMGNDKWLGPDGKVRSTDAALQATGRGIGVHGNVPPDSEEFARRMRTKAKTLAEEGSAYPGTFKKGGKVKKTGMAKVHKGEFVLTAKQAAKPAIKKVIKKVK